MMRPTLDDLRSAIQYAPRVCHPVQTGLLGWRVGDGLHVCARCAGRIMARGLGHLFQTGEAVWSDGESPSPSASCSLCGELLACGNTPQEGTIR